MLKKKSDEKLKKQRKSKHFFLNNKISEIQKQRNVGSKWRMEREFAIEFLLLIDIFYLCFYISSKAHWALYYCLIKRHRRRHNDKWTDALTRIASLCSDWHFSGAQKRKWMKPGELWGKLGFILVTLFELEQFVSTFICFYSFPLFHFF